jgi:hypothetical protein
MKTCTKCNKIKSHSEFHKKSQVSDGYAYHCKQCVKQYDDQEHNPKRVFAPKEKDGLFHCRKCEQYLEKESFTPSNMSYCKDCFKTEVQTRNMKNYGLTIEKFNELSGKQNHLCAICKKPEQNNRRLCIDHDHSCCPGRKSCGKCVRGLICTKCNKTLGMANDNVSLLQDMIDYLQK